jgi:hypothetical protein
VVNHQQQQHQKTTHIHPIYILSSTNVDILSNAATTNAAAEITKNGSSDVATHSNIDVLPQFKYQHHELQHPSVLIGRCCDITTTPITIIMVSNQTSSNSLSSYNY